MSDTKSIISSRRIQLIILASLLITLTIIISIKFNFLSGIRKIIDDYSYTNYTSEWYEKEKARYTAALSEQTYDVVILPVQAAPESLDRVSRSLMARFLAQQLRDRANLNIPDTTWVFRALGSNNRTIPITDAREFATKLHAKYIIEAYVSRPNSVNHFNLELALHESNRGVNSKEWSETKRWTLEDITFSDTEPPEIAFRSYLNSILKDIGIPLGPEPDKLQASASFNYDGSSLSEISRKSANSPIDQVMALQLFASLNFFHTDSELLWERSLIALDSVHPDSDYYRLLKSRANAHLHRRPYALKVLGEPTTPAEKSLYWYLQGSMYLADQTNENIKNSVLRLISSFEIASLRLYFNREEGYTERRKIITTKLSAWNLFIDYRLSSSDWFKSSIPSKIQELLSKENIEIEFSAKNWITSLLSVVLSKYGIPIPESFSYTFEDYINAIEFSRDAVWKQKAHEWSQYYGDRRLQEWDYFDLIYSINRDSAIKEVESISVKQVFPDKSLEKLKTLEDAFGGHPLFHTAKAQALWQKHKESKSEDEKTDLRSKALYQAKILHKLSAGENRFSRSAEWYFYELGYRNYGKYYDEPMRWDRRYSERSPSINHNVSSGDDAWLRQLAYSTVEFDTLKVYYNLLVRQGRYEDAKRLIENNKDRFIGSPFWAEQLIARYKNRTDDAAIDALKIGLDQDPNTWLIRQALARKMIARKEFKEAQILILNNPGFSIKGELSVKNTTDLAVMARELEYVDQFDLTIPIYEKAVAYDTGSWNDFWSRERLAIYNDNYILASTIAKKNIDRYDAEKDKLRYIEYLFLLGNSKEAWELIDKFSKEKDGYLPKFATSFGFSIDNISRENLVKWIFELYTIGNKNIPLWRLETIYFLSFVLDKNPTIDDIRTIKKLNAKLSKDEFIKNWYVGYAHYKRGECAKAVQPLQYANDYLINDSKKVGKPVNYALTYLASCLVQLNRVDEAWAALEHSKKLTGDGFYHKTTEALLLGHQGKHEQAMTDLEDAYRIKFTARYKPIEVSLYMVGVVEDINRNINRKEYNEFILRLAKATQSRYPTIWAPIVEVQYSKTSQSNPKKLARAMFLDQNSYRLKNIDPVNIKKARQWMKENKVFN